MQKKDVEQIKSDFWRRQGRQLIAVAVALFLVLSMAVVYKRSDIFGEFSSHNLFLAQLAVIIIFIAFTAYNWRCPACDKYLGNNIKKDFCRYCRARLR